MKLKKTLVTLTIAFFLSSITACSSNQVEPTSKVADSGEIKGTDTVKDETVINSEATVSELPTVVNTQPSRGASQSTGARASIYIVKVIISAAVTYFVTKAIVDYVKDDITGDDE